MLTTKLNRPTTKNNIVYRHELSKKLDSAKEKKLILVSAPAGFGKTTFISQWLENSKHAFIWYSLDNTDNDTAVFLRYIITGFQSIIKDYGVSSLKLLNSPNKPVIESIASLMINEMQKHQEDVYIILDDFHFITDNEVVNLVKFIIAHIPTNIHLVVLTRSDPHISTSRLRSQEQLLEIRISDLSFKTNEIATFLNKKLKLKLSNTDIYYLETKTEGWIAGLQLAALSMQGLSEKSIFIEALAGSNRYIMDYLIEEVLNQLPNDIYVFLLKTSVLKQMSSDLCNSVLNRDDSQKILEQLEKDNMFVLPLDTERKWYRYHHLFANLLKQRLSLESKSSYIETNQLACKWFEENEFYDLAIEHSLTIKDYKRSIKIISWIIEEMWEQGKHSAIINYGKTIPDDISREEPVFCLYYAWVLISKGEIAKATSFLESSENIVHNSLNLQPLLTPEEQEFNKKLYGKIAIAFAYLYSHEEQSDKMFHWCKIGMDKIPESDHQWYSWAWFTYGLACFSKGNLKESTNAYETAFNYGQRSGNIYLISTILTHLAEVEQQLGNSQSAYKRCSDLISYMNDIGYNEVTRTDWTYAPLYLIMGVSELGWAEFDKAYENIKTAYYLSKKGNDNFFKIYVSIIYSVILHYQGNKEGELIARELDILMAKTTVSPYLTSFYISSKVYWLMELDQIEQANIFVSTYGLSTNKEIIHAYGMAYAAYARLLIHQNKLAEGEALLHKIHKYALENKDVDRIVEIHLSFIVLYEVTGQKDKAIESLIKVIELSAAENQLFSLVFWADKLKNTLNEVYKILATKKTKIPKKFIDRLQLTIKNEENRRRKKTDFDLSDREIETLSLLAEELSNMEIANKLFISLNTVKTRLKNIFIKLDVDSRRNAVAKAKKNGVI